MHLPSEQELASPPAAPRRRSDPEVEEAVDDAVVDDEIASGDDDVVGGDEVVGGDDDVVAVDEFPDDEKERPAVASEVGEVSGGECKRSAVVPPQDELLRSTDFFLRCIRERTIPADLPLAAREFIGSAIGQALAANSTASGGHGISGSTYSPVRVSLPAGGAPGALPKSLEEKVKNGTFVDLSLFLPDTSTACSEEAYDVASFTPSGSDDGQRLVLQCKSSRGRTRRVETQQAWVEAFFVYADRVCVHRPDLRSDLTAYAVLINRLFGLFGFAKVYTYDKRVRAKRAGFIAAWAPVDNELYLLTLTPASQPVERVGVVKRPLPQRSNSVKPCFKWNEGKPCAFTPCRFGHVCRRCLQEGHRISECQHAVTVEVGGAPNGRSVSRRSGPPKPTQTTA
ncbi:MAG TPA: hypothetical protein V6C97_27560 [Oculatellaceae cyanobacterium]